jgi:hypothetical protein
VARAAQVGADISRRLQKIVIDIKERGHANLTRLTVLKRWFEAPRRLPLFGIFIAPQALRQAPKATEEAAELLRKAHNILADVGGDHRKVGGQAAIAACGCVSLAKRNLCPKPEPSVPL